MAVLVDVEAAVVGGGDVSELGCALSGSEAERERSWGEDASSDIGERVGEGGFG